MFAERSGWQIVREYIDYATGKNGDRDEFKAMLTDATRRKFDALLVWALDRLSREGIEQTFAYIRRLADNGVQFISYTEAHFRTNGPAGELMVAIAAWIAKQERQRISERTKAGLANARRKGKTLGRPKVLQIDENEVMRLKEQGLGVMRIANELTKAGVKVSRESVRRVLKARQPRVAE